MNFQHEAVSKALAKDKKQEDNDEIDVTKEKSKGNHL
jgi:hypothetical protein